MDEIVSIIVPVYNVEKYLARCMNSILSQTYKELQIIVVNDGSTDDSLMILQSYIDPRIIIVNKENGGLSSARNAGIKHAIGKYVTFVDSDDWIHPNTISSMVDAAEKYNADIVNVEYKIVHGDHDAGNSKGIETINAYYDEDCNTQLYLNYVPNFAWGKLFLRKLIFEEKPIMFPEGRLYEDDAIAYKYMKRCQTLVCLRGIEYYYYFMRPNSTVHTKSLKHAYDKYIVNKEMATFKTENPYWGIYRLKSLYGAYVYCLRLPNNVKCSQECKMLMHEIEMLGTRVSFELPWYKLINTPNFYKAFLFKTGLIKLISFLYT